MVQKYWTTIDSPNNMQIMRLFMCFFTRIVSMIFTNKLSQMRVFVASFFFALAVYENKMIVSGL